MGFLKLFFTGLIALARCLGMIWKKHGPSFLCELLLFTVSVEANSPYGIGRDVSPLGVSFLSSVKQECQRDLHKPFQLFYPKTVLRYLTWD